MQFFEILTMFVSDMISNVFTAIVASFFLFYLIKSYVNNKNLPPGPWGLPLLGYTPFLTLKPHLKLTELAKRYGAVFSVKLGLKSVVFVNDWESLKAAFNNDDILGRPDGFFVEGVLKNQNNIANGSGNFWKEQRRLLLRIFRDLGFGKQTMETNIKDEISKLLNEIDKQIEKPINIHKLLIPSVSNNICQFLFGHTYDYDDPIRKKMDFLLGDTPQVFQIPLMIAVLPPLFKLIKLPIFRGLRLKSTISKFIEFEKLIDDQIKEHEESMNENDIKDYFNGFLLEKKARNSDIKNYSSDSVLNSNSIALIGAGGDTVRTTLDWILKIVADDNEIQRTVQKEIDTVVGSDRLPSWSDRELMPFTQAVILETQRWVSIVPLNIPRRAIKDTKILGHTIPKDTVVVANFWALNRDPKIWQNPNDFNPYRFLSKDGKLQTYEEFTPFSYGKRSCIGEILAKFELFLYFSIILQKYDICLADSMKSSLDMWLSITMQPLEIPILQFKKRSN